MGDDAKNGRDWRLVSQLRLPFNKQTVHRVESNKRKVHLGSQTWQAVLDLHQSDVLIWLIWGFVSGPFDPRLHCGVQRDGTVCRRSLLCKVSLFPPHPNYLILNLEINASKHKSLTCTVARCPRLDSPSLPASTFRMGETLIVCRVIHCFYTNAKIERATKTFLLKVSKECEMLYSLYLSKVGRK